MASVPSSMPKGATHIALTRGLDARDGGHRALDAHVVGARRAAADAQARAATHERVGARAARDREIEVRPFEHAHGAGAPSASSQASSAFDEAVAQRGRPS